MPHRYGGVSAARILTTGMLVGVALSMAAQSVSLHRAVAGGGEQALLTLIQYRLAASDLPGGYIPQDETASTNAAIAFAQPAEQRTPVLRQLAASGRITGFQQLFAGRQADKLPAVAYLVALYRDVGSAAATVLASLPGGPTDPTDSFAEPTLGDVARALHSSVRTSDGSSVDRFIVTWSRGQVVLAVSVDGPPDTTGNMALRLAQAADAHAAAGGAFSSDAVAPDETTELALAIGLDGDQLPTGSVPEGFTRSGSYLWSNEQIELQSCLPQKEAGRLTEDLARVTGEVEYFVSNRTASVISSGYSVFYDAAGAQMALIDDPLNSCVRQAIVPLSPPVQLGEETVAFESVLIWPQGDRESYTLQWRHGQLVLSIVVNQPSGRPRPAYLGDLAKSLDNAYLSNPLPVVAGPLN